MINRFLMSLGLSVLLVVSLCAANLVPMPIGRLQTVLNKSQGQLNAAQFNNKQGISDVLTVLRTKITKGTLTLAAGWKAQVLGVAAPQVNKNPETGQMGVPVPSVGSLTIAISVGNSVYQTIVREGEAVSLSNIK
jgi:hypothetical protein